MTLANRLTLVRVALVPLVLAAYYLPVDYSGWLAAGLFVIAALTDIVDGNIARSRNEITDFGKFMDPIADKLLVTAMLFALCGDGRLNPVIGFTIVAREFIVSGIRLVAGSGGAVIAASGIAKAKTVSQIIAITALLIDNFPFSLIGFPFDTVMIWAALALTVVSGFDYAVKNKHLWGAAK